MSELINEVSLADSKTSTPVKEMKKCSQCGATLPISYFSSYGKRTKSICKSCEGLDIPCDERLKDFESRELILELRARGYKGKLSKTITKEVVI